MQNIQSVAQNCKGRAGHKFKKVLRQAFFYAFSEDEVGFCLWYIEFLGKFLEVFGGICLSFFYYPCNFWTLFPKIDCICNFFGFQDTFVPHLMRK